MEILGPNSGYMLLLFLCVGAFFVIVGTGFAVYMFWRVRAENIEEEEDY